MRNPAKTCRVEPGYHGTIIHPHNWTYDEKREHWYCRGCGKVEKVDPR